MSNGMRCGLAASVQVSAMLMLPWVVPAPGGGAQVEDRGGPQVMLMLVTSPAPTVPLTSGPAIAPGR